MSIIYLLTNPDMPGYIKIGKTESLEHLESICDSGRCKYRYACKVPKEKAKDVEKHIHATFSYCQHSSQADLFKIAPERIIAILELVKAP